MRIVITRLGKNEIKEVDYDNYPINKVLSQRNKNNTRTISYNKIPKQISISESNNTLKERNNNSLQQKIEYTQFPPINRRIKNINNINNINNTTTFNNKGSFSSKGFSYEFRTPKNKKQYLQLPKNNINILKMPNKNEEAFLNTNFNAYENAFKKIKIN